MFALTLAAVACLPMVAEAVLSRRHERTLRAAGAVEPEDDVYALMQVLYPACFLIMAGESWLRGTGLSRLAVAGAVVFSCAKALKYWAVASLGVRWTFRVLVPPGSVPISTGPYRFVRHPNYIAVAGELLGMALLAKAPLSGPLSILAFGSLMLARIRVEERALAAHGAGSASHRGGRGAR